MKKIFTMALLVLTMSSFARSQNQSTTTSGLGSEEQAVMQLEREMANAYIQGDAKTLERILADEVTNTLDNGMVFTKQAVLQTLRPMAGANADVSRLQVRVCYI